MMAASIPPEPEHVMKTTLLSLVALANFLTRRSFSSIISENSAVLKYGTCSAPMARTASEDCTGPTVKLIIYIDSFNYQ